MFASISSSYPSFWQQFFQFVGHLPSSFFYFISPFLRNPTLLVTSHPFLVEKNGVKRYPISAISRFFSSHNQNQSRPIFEVGVWRLAVQGPVDHKKEGEEHRRMCNGNKQTHR
jgi:hypothetical protein